MQTPSRKTEQYWIHAFPPTDVDEQICQAATTWFSTHAIGYKKSGKTYPRDIFSNEMKIPFTDVDKFLMSVDHNAIDAGSKDLNILIGKWLIYVDRRNVDKVWQQLSKDIEDGKLPYRAKISTAKDNVHSTDRSQQTHVICVYTPDFLWRENVREVRLILKEAGFQARLYYKPDIFTYLHMYRVYGSKINHRYFG